jgi:prophage regulatory protein
MDEMLKTHRILRMPDLVKKIGLRPSTIYELVAKAKFPKPFKIVEGGRASGWLESEIDSWLNDRAAGVADHE